MTMQEEIAITLDGENVDVSVFFQCGIMFTVAHIFELGSIDNLHYLVVIERHNTSSRLN